MPQLPCDSFHQALDGATRRDLLAEQVRKRNAIAQHANMGTMLTNMDDLQGTVSRTPESPPGPVQQAARLAEASTAAGATAASASTATGGASASTATGGAAASGGTAPTSKKCTFNSAGNCMNMTKQEVQKCLDGSKQCRTLQKKVDGLNDKIREMTASAGRKDDDLLLLTSEVNEAKKECEEIKHQNEQLKLALQDALQALKDGGKHAKSEENTQIKKAIEKWIKDYGFRKTKFVKGDALIKFMKETHEAIKDKLGLDRPDADHCTPLPEFLRIYEGAIQACLGNRRQCVQTQLLEVTKSKLLFCVHPMDCPMDLPTSRRLSNLISKFAFRPESEHVPVVTHIPACGWFKYSEKCVCGCITGTCPISGLTFFLDSDTRDLTDHHALLRESYTSFFFLLFRMGEEAWRHAPTRFFQESPRATQGG